MAANYTALSGADIVKKVRGRNIRSIVLCVLGCLASVGILIFAGIEIRNNEIGYALMAFIVGLIFLLGCIFSISKPLKTLQNVEESRIFRKFGTPDELASRISEGSMQPFFQTSQTLVTDSFIMKHGDFESYKPFRDIVLIYKKEHSTNGIKDSVFLVAYDKFGDSVDYPFKLGKKHAGEMDAVANLIAQHAPECRFGYTQDNLRYVKEHAQQI